METDNGSTSADEVRSIANVHARDAPDRLGQYQDEKGKRPWSLLRADEWHATSWTVVCDLFETISSYGDDIA